jgi:hypothetical protein
MFRNKIAQFRQKMFCSGKAVSIVLNDAQIRLLKCR